MKLLYKYVKKRVVQMKNIGRLPAALLVLCWLTVTASAAAVYGASEADDSDGSMEILDQEGDFEVPGVSAEEKNDQVMTALFTKNKNYNRIYLKSEDSDKDNKKEDKQEPAASLTEESAERAEQEEEKKVKQNLPVDTETEEDSIDNNNIEDVAEDIAYTPDSFSWSGGTGRISISCPEIHIRDGQAYATLVFSSPNYQYVKAGGVTCYGTVSGETSVFEVPVELNANNTILGMTTAMSQGHEVEYSIYVGLDAAGSPDHPDSDDGSGEELTTVMGTLEKLENAPEIPGLVYRGTLKMDCAEYYRLHYYEDDFILLEIYAGKDIGRTDLDEEHSALYGNTWLWYLIVPEEAELPAGVQKEMMIIQQPVEHAYAASVNALKILERMDALGSIAAVGFDAESCPVDAVVRAMEKEEIIFAGTYREPQFRDLVLCGSDLAIVPGEILSEEEQEKEQEDESQVQAQEMKELGEQFLLLNIPMILDRSGDEKEKLGQYEWCKAFGAIFGRGDAAADLYDAAAEALGGGAADEED